MGLRKDHDDHDDEEVKKDEKKKDEPIIELITQGAPADEVQDPTTEEEDIVIGDIIEDTFTIEGSFEEIERKRGQERMHIDSAVHFAFNIFNNRPKRILDLSIGAGGTSLAFAAKFPGAHILGTDKNPIAVEKAKARLAELKRKNPNRVLNVDFREQNVLSDFPEGKFDGIYETLFGMYIPRVLWPRFATKLYDALNEGGTFWSHGVNFDALRDFFKKSCPEVYEALDMFMAPMREKDLITDIPRELPGILEAAGFVVASGKRYEENLSLNSAVHGKTLIDSLVKGVVNYRESISTTLGIPESRVVDQANRAKEQLEKAKNLPGAITLMNQGYEKPRK